jgi:hypothetical protein
VRTARGRMQQCKKLDLLKEPQKKSLEKESPYRLSIRTGYPNAKISQITD